MSLLVEVSPQAPKPGSKYVRSPVNVFALDGRGKFWLLSRDQHSSRAFRVSNPNLTRDAKGLQPNQ